MSDIEVTPEFRAMVESEITALGFTPLRWDGPQLHYSSSDGSERELGTTNLFKRVKLNDPADAPELISGFVKSIVAVVGDDWKMPETLEECPNQLLPRIGLPFDPGENAPWSRPVPGTDGLCINLVIDFPTTMAYVTTPMLRKSNTSPGDWFDLALENLKAITKPDWLQPLKGDHGIHVCHTADSYDAARALILCELTNSDAAGWLVAVPARDWLFARKVDASGLAHFHQLKVIATKAKGEQPYPISDTVYWVRPGKRWMEFKIEMNDGQITLTPPQELIDALNLVVGEKE